MTNRDHKTSIPQQYKHAYEPNTPQQYKPVLDLLNETADIVSSAYTVTEGEFTAILQQVNAAIKKIGVVYRPNHWFENCPGYYTGILTFTTEAERDSYCKHSHIFFSTAETKSPFSGRACRAEHALCVERCGKGKIIQLCVSYAEWIDEYEEGIYKRTSFYTQNLIDDLNYFPLTLRVHILPYLEEFAKAYQTFVYDNLKDILKDKPVKV